MPFPKDIARGSKFVHSSHEPSKTTSEPSHEELVKELGPCNIISNQTGDIDNTSYAHIVRYFEDHNVYIKLEGFGLQSFEEGKEG